MLRQHRDVMARLREQTRPNWYAVENKAGEAPKVFIYDDIGYYGLSADDFQKELRALTADAIDIHINTEGGSVIDGIAIYNAIRNHSAHITTHVDSLAASIGSVIAMAGDTVVMSRNARMMIHDAHIVAAGNADDLRQTIAVLDDFSNNIADIYAQRAGGTVEEWRAVMKTEKWYSAQDALSVGLIDSIDEPSRKAAASTQVPVASSSTSVTPVAPTPSIIDPDVIRQAIQEVTK